MFELLSARTIDAGEICYPPLRRLWHWWFDRNHDGRLPSRGQFDPAEFSPLLGRINLVDVEPDPLRFRFRLYGSGMKNVSGRSMRGLTTTDYDDAAYGRMVTEHYARAFRAAWPLAMIIAARLDGEPYDYTRIILPLAEDGALVNQLLVASIRDLCDGPAHLIPFDPFSRRHRPDLPTPWTPAPSRDPGPAPARARPPGGAEVVRLPRR